MVHAVNVMSRFASQVGFATPAAKAACHLTARAASTVGALHVNAHYPLTSARKYSVLSSESPVQLVDLPVPGFERVVMGQHKASGLKTIVAIHSTEQGPALGGLRILPYETVDKALEDVKRLAQGMTYKSALAGCGLGGGKSVIISHSKHVTEAMLVAYAEVLNRLEGKYICAEDVGSTVEQMDLIWRHTPYVTGLSHPHSSGNPSPFTAWGVFRAMQATSMLLDRNPSLKGWTIAIQGLGSVGANLAEILFWNGASLIVADVDPAKVEAAVRKFGAVASDPKEIHKQRCDIFSPCALGATINPETIPELRCKAIVGCANNQLLSLEDARELQRLNIFYATDFAVNSGGVTNIGCELDEKGYSPIAARNKVNQVAGTVLDISYEANKNGITTHEAAVAIAERKIAQKEGVRLTPPRLRQYQPPQKTNFFLYP